MRRRVRLAPGGQTQSKAPPPDSKRNAENRHKGAAVAKYALYVGGFDENPSVWQDRHAFFLSLSGKQEQKRNPLLLLFYFNMPRAGTVCPLPLRARKAALHGNSKASASCLQSKRFMRLRRASFFQPPPLGEGDRVSGGRSSPDTSCELQRQPAHPARRT